jgi:outer membrane lipoprotein-sorting protein
MKRSTLALAGTALSAALAAVTMVTIAHADAAGDKVLTAMDAALNRAKTLTFEYEVVNQEPGKAERKLGMGVRLKGDKRLSEFSAPADMKGTKVLILSPTQMYVYLPAFGKVRRIASHVSDQGFMGLAFSQDDMATTSYTVGYTAQIASETPTQWRLVATPKAGQQTTYAKIEILVNKDKSVPAELKYFNAAGTNVKTETRSDYSCEGDVCTPRELKMVDNTKGNWTKLVRKSWKVNDTISDDVFSTRGLGE